MYRDRLLRTRNALAFLKGSFLSPTWIPTLLRLQYALLVTNQHPEEYDHSYVESWGTTTSIMSARDVVQAMKPLRIQKRIQEPERRLACTQSNVIQHRHEFSKSRRRIRCSADEICCPIHENLEPVCLCRNIRVSLEYRFNFMSQTTPANAHATKPAKVKNVSVFQIYPATPQCKGANLLKRPSYVPSGSVSRNDSTALSWYSGRGN